jgi:hypothetical protein
MHPSILHAIRNRHEFDLELGGHALDAMLSKRVTQDGLEYETYIVSYDHCTILRWTSISGFVPYRTVINDEVFVSDFAYNRATRTNAISDALAAALGL